MSPVVASCSCNALCTVAAPRRASSQSPRIPCAAGVAHPRRVLVAEDGVREEGGGDRTALIWNDPSTPPPFILLK
jgi:hypothetical protein